MSLEESEEEYWAASRVKNSKKKVNIFDDSITVETAADFASFKKSVVLEADDDDDEIAWNEDPVTAGRSTSGSGSLPGSASSHPRPTFEPQYEPPQPQPTRQTHIRSRSDVAVGRMSDLSLPKFASAPDRHDKPDSEPDLFTVAQQGSSYPGSGRGVVAPARPEITHTGSKQEQEIQYLKRQLSLAKSALGTSKLTVDDAIMRLLNGQPVSLEHFKSKEEKLSLLDKAISLHEGNAIIAAIVFLKQTLRKQLFNCELLRRPVAMDQYLAYLKAQYNVDEYAEMLELLPDRREELAMYRYRQAVKVDDSGAKIQRLQGCLQAFFEMVPGMEHDCSLIQEQISLLQRQRPVDIADNMTEKQGKHLIFNQVPRAASIINMPVITTLYYCCLYHYDEGENLLSSPASIRKAHQLTEKQFIWTAVKARARLHKWFEIDALFTTKGLFGTTKKKCPIGFHRVASILHKAGASPDIVSQYLMLVDDVNLRLELAKKLQCPDAVVETYRVQRDKQALGTYFSQLKQNSREWFLARDALHDPSIRWK